ncbi:MAG: tetratricopeptide repeat protein, partial [Desulfovibrio sp.]|nr:tetratricopeptide repeat protein [Desulfovibrio sp.]
MNRFPLYCASMGFALLLIPTFSAPPQAADARDRGLISSPQDIRSSVNRGGPEDWPEHEGLSTSRSGAPLPGSSTFESDLPTPAPTANSSGSIGAIPETPTFAEPDYSSPPPAPVASPTVAPENTPAQASSPATRPAAGRAPSDVETHTPEGGQSMTARPSRGEVVSPSSAPTPEPAPQEKEVIYVDEQGNPVPKPPEPEKMIAEAQELMEQGKHDDALAILEQTRQIPGLSRDLLEQVLYNISDALWARYADNPLAGFEPIVSATNEALNANIRSPRVPDALLRLGLANIKVGNLSDASGYIVALMRRFPDFPGVAQGFAALGEAQLKAGANPQAEQSFGIILDKYPESSQLEAASVGLAKALVNQGKDERAQVILDFISKRWPRYYINEPEFLLMQAANDEKMNRPDAALALDWLYVNLDPQRPSNAPLLLKMGDQYSKNGNPVAANFVYEDIRRNFPDSPAAVTAAMRLAEKGVYDSPITYDEMSKVFGRAANPGLWRTYNDLANSAKGSPEQILSQLKQAMWLYWDKQYPEAMGKAADFIDNYPEHKDIAEAREILWDAFQKEFEQSLRERNYGRILLLWNGFPYIRERYGKIDAPLRYALSQGWLERGDEEKSFELLADFLQGPMDPEYGEAAFSQFFNHYLKNQNWDKILDLGNLVHDWNMKPELRNQLAYAEALSAQNLNLGAAALNRWKNLATRTDIPLYQQAYATYFLAKDAENRRDIRAAYEGNRQLVEMFTRSQDERSDT